jgi:hypothetical protein
MNRFQTLLSISTCAATAREEKRFAGKDAASRRADYGGAVQVDSIKIRVESAAWFQRLKLKYNMLSSFAFTFNLRHYSTAPVSGTGVVSAAGYGLSDNACHVIIHILDPRLLS